MNPLLEESRVHELQNCLETVEQIEANYNYFNLLAARGHYVRTLLLKYIHNPSLGNRSPRNQQSAEVLTLDDRIELMKELEKNEDEFLSVWDRVQDMGLDTDDELLAEGPYPHTLLEGYKLRLNRAALARITREELDELGECNLKEEIGRLNLNTSVAYSVKIKVIDFGPLKKAINDQINDQIDVHHHHHHHHQTNK